MRAAGAPLAPVLPGCFARMGPGARISSIMARPHPTQRSDPSFSALVAEHRAPLLSYIARMGVHEDDVDDVAQEVLTAAYLQRERFDPSRASFRAWLLGIATREIRSHRRHLRRRREQLPPDDSFEPISEEAPSSEVRLIDKRREAVLDELLDEIPEKRRCILVLHDLSGVEMTEIARELSLNISTAWARYRAARRDLDAAVRRWQARQQRKGYDIVPAVLVPLLEEARAERARTGLHDPSRATCSPADRGAAARRPRTGIGQRLGGPAVILAMGLLGPVDGTCDQLAPRVATLATFALPPLPVASATPSVESRSTATPPPSPPAAGSALAAPARPLGKPDPRAQLLAEERFVNRAIIAMNAGQLQHALQLLEQHERRYRDGLLASRRNELLRRLRGR